jgi:F0F1-type ATP synthase assembly protein I
VSPDNKKEGDASDWVRVVREATPYLGIGTSLAVSVLLGIGAGHWADRRLGTSPWLLLAGGALGTLTGFWQAYRTVIRK